MEWIVIGLPVILWGFLGIYLGRNKHRIYKLNQAFQMNQLKKLIAFSSKGNLIFEGVFDFLIHKKFLYTYQKNHQHYFIIKTLDNQFEHHYPVKSLKEYNAWNEGDIIPLGLIKHSYKPDIFIATNETDPNKAITSISRSSKMKLSFALIVALFFFLQLGYLVLLFISSY